LPTAGLYQLREKVAEHYNDRTGSNYKADNVIIGPGSKELMFLMQYVIDDVDTLIQSPSWVSYNN
jgi:aspartate aminotransferase